MTPPESLLLLLFLVHQSSGAAVSQPLPGSSCFALARAVQKYPEPRNCIFPFTLGTNSYSGCVPIYDTGLYPTRNKEYQCPIEVSDKKETYEWGVCQPNCPKIPFKKEGIPLMQVVSTILRHKGCYDLTHTSKCLFPYEYGGALWATCIPGMKGYKPNGDIESQFYCPTKLDKSGIPKIWTECGPKCPLYKRFKPIHKHNGLLDPPSFTSTLPYIELVPQKTPNKTNNTLSH